MRERRDGGGSVRFGLEDLLYFYLVLISVSVGFCCSQCCAASTKRKRGARNAHTCGVQMFGHVQASTSAGSRKRSDDLLMETGCSFSFSLSLSDEKKRGWRAAPANYAFTFVLLRWLMSCSHEREEEGGGIEIGKRLYIHLGICVASV